MELYLVISQDDEGIEILECICKRKKDAEKIKSILNKEDRHDWESYVDTFILIKKLKKKINYEVIRNIIFKNYWY